MKEKNICEYSVTNERGRVDSSYYNPVNSLKKRFAPLASPTLAKARLKMTECLCLGYFLTIVILVGYYILFPAKGVYHSDTTDTLMWAQAALKSGSMFNKDFNYACIAPFGGYIFMLPYVAIFGFSLKANAFGMLTFFILFTIALYAVLKKLEFSDNKCCVITATTILLVSGSTKLREIFFDHILHYSLNLFFSLVGLLLIFSMIDSLASKEKLKKSIVCAVLLFIWCFLASLNQSTTLLLFIFPLFSAYVLERLLAEDKAKSAREYYFGLAIPVIIAAAALLGYIAADLIIGDSTAAYQEMYSVYSPLSEWGENLLGFYIDWYTLFGVDILGMQEILTIYGIVDLLIVVVATMIFVTPFVLLSCYKHLKNRKVCILLLFHFAQSLFLMIIYTLGVVSNVNWRLTPIMFTSALITLVAFAELAKVRRYKCLSRFVALPVLFIAIFNGTYFMLPPDFAQQSGYFAVAQELEEFGEKYGIELEYGYATYWHSQIISLINEETIPVRCFEITEDGYCARQYQTYTYWHDDQAGVENYFVLLSKEEFQYVQKTKNELIHKGSICDMPMIFKISNGDYYILIYSENIF